LIKIDIDPIGIVAGAIRFFRDMGINRILKGIRITGLIELLVSPLGKVYLEVTSWPGRIIAVAGKNECNQ
jgi:hypothetical protein